jgi:hypothetical protein
LFFWSFAFVCLLWFANLWFVSAPTYGEAYLRGFLTNPNFLWISEKLYVEMNILHIFIFILFRWFKFWTRKSFWGYFCTWFWWHLSAPRFFLILFFLAQAESPRLSHHHAYFIFIFFVRFFLTHFGGILNRNRNFKENRNRNVKQNRNRNVKQNRNRNVKQSLFFVQIVFGPILGAHWTETETLSKTETETLRNTETETLSKTETETLRNTETETLSKTNCLNHVC